MTEEINWSEAVASSGFVRLETDTSKMLVVKNWRLEKVEKFGEMVIEFQADVIEEDDEPVEKLFTASSKRLKTKLRPIFENADKTVPKKISILKVGDRFDTQYSVKDMTNQKTLK